MSGGACVLRADGNCSNAIWKTGCVGLFWVVFGSVSAPPSAFLKRSEPSGLLSTNTPLLHFIYLCRYREVEPELPCSFIYCELKDHSCTQVSLD